MKMDFVAGYVDIILHLDKHLGALIQQYGVWTYLVLFLVIFCETGLVVTPFLPGDSLLFTAGAFAANGALDVVWLFISLTVASIIGDTVNYWAGKYAGPNILHKRKIRFINREHLLKTEKFYEKHGAKTIILARFLPIFRTFAPFVAGIGNMRYSVFITYNVIGGVLWNATFLFGGYFFGNIPLIKENFTAVIFIIIFVTLLPAAKEFLNHYLQKRTRRG